MFWFSADKYDFWPVYDAIKKYYPIGIQEDKDDRFPFYTTYPGYKALVKLIEGNFHLPNALIPWNNFQVAIQAKAQKGIVETTYGQIPCFSAFIEMEKLTFGDVIRTKELHFFVSLLGPFYTIIGQDNIDIQREYEYQGRNSKSHFQAAHYLVPSPEDEYANAFDLLCEMIEERFTGYRFVPFYMHQQTIEGLQAPYSNNKAASVFDALFTSFRIKFPTNTIGDDYFKADDWIKEGYIDDGSRWHVFPPGYTEEQIKAGIENADLRI